MSDATRRPTLVSAVPCGAHLAATLPPGEYFVGDPCYVLGDELYDALGDMIFPPGDMDGRDIHAVVPLPDGPAHVIDIRTAYGDGSYPFRAASGAATRLLVDSGGLAVIDVRLRSPDKPRHGNPLTDLGAVVTLTAPEFVTASGGEVRCDAFEFETVGPDGDDEEGTED